MLASSAASPSMKNERGELVAKTEMKNTTVGRAILRLIVPKGLLLHRQQGAGQKPSPVC
ncbi:hypothetical protein ACNKHQ_23595 [Shigella flexneri]